MNWMKQCTRLALGLVLVFALSLTSEAQAADTGTVSGKVMKDSNAVAGAKVRLINPADAKGKRGGGEAPAAAPEGGKRGKGGKGDAPKAVAESTTESDGSFKLADVPAGEYVLIAQARGQGRAHEKVSVKAGETTTVNLTLQAGKGAGKGPGGGKKGKGKE